MTLTDYLGSKGTSEDEKAWAYVAAVMDASGADRVRSNVEAESRLSTEAWETVAEVFAEARREQMTWEEIAHRLCESFRAMQQEGPSIAHTPSPKGRVMDIGRFRAFLEEAEVFRSPEAAKRFLDRLRNGASPPDPYHVLLRKAQLGVFLIWSTFHESEADPFAACTDAASIRNYVSLPPPEDGADTTLVLLVYTIPDDVTLHAPTIADAYSGDPPWTMPFACAPPGDAWGTTQGGAPEVVHDVIHGDCLLPPDSHADLPAVRTQT